MPRGYLSASARCRQLEHLVNRQPGITIAEIVASTSMSYQSVCTYMQRLIRERRVDVLLDDPATGHSCLQRFYPKGNSPRPPAQKAA